MKDLFGLALLDYQNGNYTEDIITSTSISDEDVLPLPYLFRDFEDMPKIEQTALELSRGKVLDVGCGAGSHSLHLQNQGLEVKAIDISEHAIKVARARGVKNGEVLSVLDETDRFDTIILLMNGTGIFQEITQVSKYLKKLKTLLNTGGQIFIDSTDIKYMYEDDDGGIWIDTNVGYYGELDYYVSYKGESEIPMKWLYLDFDSLAMACETLGLKCDMVQTGEHYDYLARITINN